MSLSSALPDDFHLFSVAGLALSAGLFAVLSTIYTLGSAIYNVFFHPLKHIPGPVLSSASGIPNALRMRNGSVVAWVKKQHEKYGEVVRVGPSEVSFISGDTAWQDIYGFRIGKHKNTGIYDKDRTWYPPPVNGVASIIPADEDTHSRMRRNLSHAFSDKALRAQEPLMQTHINLLVTRLHEQAANKVPFDIVSWYNFTTFDVISDLSFGEPLGLLRDGNKNNYIGLVIASIKGAGWSSVLRRYPFFAYYDKFMSLFTSKVDILAGRMTFYRQVKEKVAVRLEKGVEERSDFFNFIIKNQGKEAQKLSRGEMDSNALVFLLAGSETTATTLSGATYLLLRNPEKLAKLNHEVRSAFSSIDDITIDGVLGLPYLNATLHESLRCYPPVPTGFPRVVPPGGNEISGHYIPGGTSVYVGQYATNHSARNFKNPDDFVPERWTEEGKEEYASDKKEAWNAFSFGPRNCLGKNLAYAEMRVILAKVLYDFDLELMKESNEWMGTQKVFTLWEKAPLMVKLKPVQR